MSNLFKKSIALIFGMNTIPFLLFAQDNPIQKVNAAGTPLAMVMIIIALVLAFVIWGMGQVIVVMGKQVMDKIKKSEKLLPVVLLCCFMLTSLYSQAQSTTENQVVTSPADYGGMNPEGFWTLATILTIEVIVILFMMFFIKKLQQELLPERIKKPVPFKSLWNKLDKRFFTKAVPLEKEADFLLDHDYDGIRELDNSLPPWWKYGFYVTLLVAIIYLFNFHVFGYGKNPDEEYQAEMEKAKIALAEFASQNADKIDETNVQMPQQGGLDEGKEIFTSVCWTCHGKQGEGGTGPNLTDNYWIHKGSLNDIFASIKHGYPDKGMQAWEKNYSPKQINNLAGYIKTLKGTNPPNPKAPQGDLFTEDSAVVKVVKVDTMIKSK